MNIIPEPTTFNILMEETAPGAAFLERYQHDMTTREMLQLKCVALFELGRVSGLIEAIDEAAGLFLPVAETKPVAADDGFQLGAVAKPVAKVALADNDTADAPGLDGMAKPIDIKLS